MILAAMVALTKSMCWKVVARTVDSSGIGLVIYQKPVSPSCYEKRKNNNYAPLCDQKDGKNSSWYFSKTHSLHHINIAAAIFNAIGALPENQFFRILFKFYPYLC